MSNIFIDLGFSEEASKELQYKADMINFLTRHASVSMTVLSTQHLSKLNHGGMMRLSTRELEVLCYIVKCKMDGTPCDLEKGLQDLSQGLTEPLKEEHLAED